MIKISSLGSGSKGNCVLVDNGKNRILIDAGLSANIIVKRLLELGIALPELDGIFITHEHDDHIKGVENLSNFVPIYSHPLTLDSIAYSNKIPYKQMMEMEDTVSLGTFDITPFPISHDAVHPCGYSISDWESKFTYVTDTGYVSKGTLNISKGSDCVMLESNHDTELLNNGAYPPFLKRRILSQSGHLSNIECALTVADLIESGTVKIMLAHLSDNNNLPELAYWTTKNHLRSKNIAESDYTLKIASQTKIVQL